MKTIVVSSDLSSRSDIAVTRALRLAKQTKAKLHVVHFVDPDLPDAMADTLLKAAQEYLARQIEKIAGGKVDSVVVDCHFGDPWIALLEFLDRVNADLAVLGAQRPSRLADLFRGSTLHRLLRHLKTPALVVVKPATKDYERPLVGVDFSACSKRAAYLAMELAPQKPLYLAHAYYVPFKGLTAQVDRHGHAIGSEAHRVLAEAKEQMDDFVALLGTTAQLEIVLEEGGTVSALPEIAKRFDNDLICVGAHSRSWLPKAILGSTAEELLAIPRFDVLIAPL